MILLKWERIWRENEKKSSQKKTKKRKIQKKGTYQNRWKNLREKKWQKSSNLHCWYVSVLIIAYIDCHWLYCRFVFWFHFKSVSFRSVFEIVCDECLLFWSFANEAFLTTKNSWSARIKRMQQMQLNLCGFFQNK